MLNIAFKDFKKREDERLYGWGLFLFCDAIAKKENKK